MLLVFFGGESTGYWWIHVTGPWFNIKISYQYRISHCGDKTILWPSYLHNGISCTGKMTSLHYTDVIMTTMASQITSLMIVYSIVYWGADQRKTSKLRVWHLCGEFTGTGEFPAQKASNVENVSIWWRHHDIELGPKGPVTWKAFPCHDVIMIIPAMEVMQPYDDFSIPVFFPVHCPGMALDGNLVMMCLIPCRLSRDYHGEGQLWWKLRGSITRWCTMCHVYYDSCSYSFVFL